MHVSPPPTSSDGVRSALRSATAEDHRRVDALFGACDLAHATHYRAFLVAHAAAFLPVEAALDRHDMEAWLPDWARRRRGSELRADLSALGEAPPPALAIPAFADEAEALGAVYVLEGSRMGAALLRRSLPGDAPQRFLGAVQPTSAWRQLVVQLEIALAGPEALAAAVSSARTVFRLFERAGEHYLESVAR